MDENGLFVNEDENFKNSNWNIPKIIIKKKCGKFGLFLTLPFRFGKFEKNTNNRKWGWIEPQYLFILRLPQASRVSKTQWAWWVQKSSILGNNGTINLPCAPPPILPPPPSPFTSFCYLWWTSIEFQAHQ